MKLRLFFVLFIALFSVMFSPTNVQAQAIIENPTPIECGDIIEAETNPNERQQDFQILAPAGTVLNGRVEPLGSTFNVIIWFTDTGGSVFSRFNQQLAGLAEEFIDFSLGTSNPILRVGGINPEWTDVSNTFSSGWFDYYGAYSIILGCTLRDGTVIEPGSQPPASSGTSEIVEVFTGYGFPGLPSVDFNNAFMLPLASGTPFPGQIPATGPGVIGFTLNAAANDTLDLKFDRTSGNLNLGVVVLFGQDQVLFYGGLIASNTLSTTLTLPTDGQYTIGVFRVDLVPPVAPEATAFQVLGTLNP